MPPSSVPLHGPDPAAPATVLVTGGAGFVGVNLVRRFLDCTRWRVVTVDALTYAANPASQAAVRDERHRLVRMDVRAAPALRALFEEARPDAVVHLAAESHVDRSIDAPAVFLETNVLGTFAVLQEALRYWRTLDAGRAARFRLLHASTDEVFGSLPEDAAPADEESAYRPTSPYAASKAASDHLVRAWHATYGLPCLTTHASNVYGPFQFPEKLIPLVIQRALRGEPLPVYGAGENVRDWLHVADLADALLLVLTRAPAGERYCIAGGNPRRNLDVVRRVCAELDALRPDPAGPRERLITFVEDRPGHDLRYAMRADRIAGQLGWSPRRAFEEGLRDTVRWYVENQAWCEAAAASGYRQERLGLGGAAGVPASSGRAGGAA